MCDDAPKFGNAGEGGAKSTRIIGGLFDRFPCNQVFGHSGTMCINEKICIDGYQECFASQSCIAVRSVTSTPGGNPPLAVTQRIFFRPVHLFVRGAANCWRRPASTSSRSGLRNSAARFLAAMSSSSGNSIVVFIRLAIFTYYHIYVSKQMTYAIMQFGDLHVSYG